MSARESVLQIIHRHVHGAITALIWVEVGRTAIDAIRNLDIRSGFHGVVTREDRLRFRVKVQAGVLKGSICANAARIVCSNDYIQGRILNQQVFCD